MGMFDYLRIDYTLAEKEVQNELFQTKSINKLLDYYHISKDGKLYTDDQDIFDIDDDEDQLKKLKLKSISYSGIIVFYTSLNKKLEPAITFYYFKDATLLGELYKVHWYEYEATFNEGNLEKLTRVENREIFNSSYMVSIDGTSFTTNPFEIGEIDLLEKYIDQNKLVNLCIIINDNRRWIITGEKNTQ